MNETTQLVHDTLERILRDTVDSGLRERAETHDGAAAVFPAALWQTLSSSGLTMASVPEALGGPGLPLADAFALVRLIGAHAAPVPLAEHLLTARVLAEQSVALPDGVLSLVCSTAADTLVIENNTARGELALVPWGRMAERVLVVLPSGQAVLLSPADAEITTGRNIAGEPWDTLRCNATPVQHIDTGAWLPANLQLNLALMRAVMLSGAMSAVLNTSIDYVQMRKQFGKPISGFQAIQHSLAVMAGECAAAQRMADAALEAHGTAGFANEVAAAKARAGEAAGIVAAVAHQVHGAMGFTHEHHLHHFTRRLMAWRDDYGNEVFWQRELGRAISAVGADQAWSFLTTSGGGRPGSSPDGRW